MPRPANRSSILPIATTVRDADVSRSSSVSPRGGSAKSRRLAVRLKLPGAADERARDDAADAQPFARQTVGDVAGSIELRHGNDLFVRGDLEDAVGRRVHDPVAGLHVLGAELVDDRRAGRGLVAEHAAAGLAARTRRGAPRENPFGNTGNARSSTMPIISQCPVTESLPAEASAMRPTAVGTLDAALRRRRRAERGDAAETERAQRRQRRAARRSRCGRACRCPRRRTRRHPAARRSRRCRGR